MYTHIVHYLHPSWHYKGHSKAIANCCKSKRVLVSFWNFSVIIQILFLFLWTWKVIVYLREPFEVKIPFQIECQSVTFEREDHNDSFFCIEFISIFLLREPVCGSSFSIFDLVKEWKTLRVAEKGRLDHFLSFSSSFYVPKCIVHSWHYCPGLYMYFFSCTTFLSHHSIILTCATYTFITNTCTLATFTHFWMEYAVLKHEQTNWIFFCNRSCFKKYPSSSLA